jgi:hypothetical protein
MKYLKTESDKIIAAGSTPEIKAKLEGIQWKCNKIREKNGDNYTKSLLEINELMRQSLENLRKAYNGEYTPDNNTNNIIPFDKPEE